MLWEFLGHMIDTWDGEYVLLGDFSEVCSSNERHGTVLNANGANAFNNFITMVGDENSKNFHGNVNKKRSHLAIHRVLVKGDWILDHSNVKKEILNHFSNRFDKLISPRLLLESQFPNVFTSDQLVDLERDVTHEEIKKAVWDFGINKSPGPDGYTIEFFHRYWKIIDNDAVAVVLQSFSLGILSPGCNSSFIAPIPKTQEAKVVKYFRPISLKGSVYKIIAKILANRLTLVISSLISEVQSAFISKHQILDDPFILNELLSWCKHKNSKAVIFKVDFEKAFDSVRWDYLDDVLTKFGFGVKWCTWIQSCLNSAMGSILVNGSPTLEFKFYKGLKQEDPLSLFLFILIMESLRFSFKNVVNAGLYKGLSIDSSLTLSHLFYDDDAMFIDVLSAAESIGCSTFAAPFNFLGVKMGGLTSRRSS
nr:RNA-directed DNA polymerase, eukaryota, reverse transcriptase zinc-binding domain protein [Tanacetum cinerariifolium]